MDVAENSLRVCYGSPLGSSPIIPILDIRDPSQFQARRLPGSVNIPAGVLLERLFLLSDKDLQLAIVVPADTTAIVVELNSRGWTYVAPCIVDDEGFWGVAAAAGLVETGAPHSQCWLFRPCTLLMQEADRVEHLLLASHPHHLSLQASQEQAPSRSTTTGHADLCRQPAAAPRQHASVDISSPVWLRCLDIGSGSGRDLAWLGIRRTQFSLGSDGSTRPAGSDPPMGGSSNSSSSSSPQSSAHTAGSQPQLHMAGDTPGPARTHMPTPEDGPAESHGQNGHQQQQHHQNSQLQHPQLLQQQREQEQEQEPVQPVQPVQQQGSGILGLRWHVTGIDSWPGSLDRAQQLFNVAGLTPASAALHCASVDSITGQLGTVSSGAGAARIARELGKCRATQTAAGLPPLVTPLPALWPPAQFDLLLCVRFLERSFLATLPALLRVGGILLYSHFLDLPGTRTFGRPTGAKHVLAQGELAQYFCARGFEVLRDDFEVLPDGRELSMFMARKVNTAGHTDADQLFSRD
ncbi:MAG: hypothetical protein WDW38_001453 [Sanguina aurantia]